MSLSYFSSIKDTDDEKDFRTYLQEAHETDLSEFERTGCVSEGKDFKNNHVIVMIPGLGLNKQERPETMFRKMLLLFLRKTHELVGTAYSVVYAHTNIDLMNQYPLIYKFYSILPRTYKKNLQKMYVVHPNVGIRMFFEFARVFLSHKFYNKLCLLESILEFQRIIPPTQLSLPLKFLRKEDEEFEYKYCGTMASLMKSYDAALGTTSVLDCCATFIRENQGLVTSGLFRVPGDENELNLARVRLQYAYSSMARENMSGVASAHSSSSSSSGNGKSDRGLKAMSVRMGSSSGSGVKEEAYVPSSYSRIVLSENHKSIVIGDLNVLYSNLPAPASNINEHTHDSWKSSSSSVVDTSGDGPMAEIPFSVVTINNLHTIAQIFKMSIRDLSDPLIPTDCYNDLVRITRQFEFGKMNVHWEIAVGRRLALLPIEHIATLIHVISFLREVSEHVEHNQMDAHNLAVVFAPTIFRPEMTDPIKAAMEVKLTQVILMEIIKRERVLALAIIHWKGTHDRINSASIPNQRQQMVPNGVLIQSNPVLNPFHENILRRGWTSFEEMFPIEEQQEAQLTTFGSSASLKSTDSVDYSEVNRVQTEEEIQDMIATHMKSAMKGRMNLRGRELQREDVIEERESFESGRSSSPVEATLSIADANVEKELNAIRLSDAEFHDAEDGQEQVIEENHLVDNEGAPQPNRSLPSLPGTTRKPLPPIPPR